VKEDDQAGSSVTRHAAASFASLRDSAEDLYMRYAVADVANPPLFRKGLSNSLLTQKDAVLLLLTFCAVPIMARFFPILPPRSAAPASSVGGHY